MITPARIALVEDDAQLLEGIAQLFIASGEVEMTGTFSSAENFINHLPEPMPDVVLMDIGLPGMSGIECVSLLKAHYPDVQFLMWTTFEDDDKIVDALRAGATGYLLKNSTIEAMLSAIRDSMRGGSPMSSTIARKVIDSFRSPANALDQFNLTAREKEILTWLSKGHRYKEIAAQLGISIETVRKHIRNMYEKLHVQSRTDALNKVFPVR